MTTWLHLHAERVLYVDRGRDVILCERNLPNELVVQLSTAQLEKLCAEIHVNMSKSDHVLVRELRTISASHAKDGERLTAHYLALAADRIEQLSAAQNTQEHSPSTAPAPESK